LAIGRIYVIAYAKVEMLLHRCDNRIAFGQNLFRNSTVLLSDEHLGTYSGAEFEVFLYDQERRHAGLSSYLVSVNDIRFKPGSNTAQSSSSESKIIDSSKPANVNPGAV